MRQKADARYGQLLEWWAETNSDGRVTAVVLGDSALVTVDPTVNTSGRPAYRVAALQLAASSFRSVRVTGPTGEPSSSRGGVENPPPASKGGPGAPPPARVEPELSGFLGNLPARAQRLLQEPFRTGTDPLDWRYHYLRHGSGRGLSTASLQFWCYLTDLRTVTFAAGTGYGYRDGAGADSWQLTCWLASRR